MSGKTAEAPIYDDVERLIGRIVDDNVTTWDAIYEVAVQFCYRNYQYHKDFAKSIGEKPITVIMLALLHTSHPLICCSSGPLWGLVRCQAEILKAELEQRELPMPTHLIHSQIPPVSNVDKMPKTSVLTTSTRNA
jgi:hypothetical protein